eukprot:TRINITY_DN39441_c0_g1_i1.p1 TRINITY_DN39441_c0_g1~~TRINITY_DN39441_c0_g1_i1.p1  ORF type:complete len:343 (+),score=150.28 TRINITY_DN39441_c0_g1_i1:161-1189(+)
MCIRDRVCASLQAEQQHKSNQLSQVQAELAAARVQLGQFQADAKQQQQQLELSQTMLVQLKQKSDAFRAQLRHELELEQSDKRSLQSLLDAERAESSKAARALERREAELEEQRSVGEKLRGELAAKEREMQKMLVLSEAEAAHKAQNLMSEAYSQQHKQLAQVRESHLKVVAEKDRQLEELTAVLRRQTEQLKKHRLAAPAAAAAVPETAPAAVLSSHSRWLASMSRDGKQITHGDFWRLSDARAGSAWAAWQYHLGPEKAGVAYFFRRDTNSEATIQLGLKTIEPDLVYLVEIFRTCELLHSEHMKGSQLTQHAITIQQAPGSLLVQYSQVTARELQSSP